MTAQTVSSAMATRDAGPIKFMWSKRAHLQTVLPRSVDVEAFLGTAAGALYASDVPGKSLTLWKCAQSSPDSLFVALMECAVLGHLPGTEEYYLTPRMDHGRMKVLGIEGYRGVIERMYRSGAVSKVVVREVCENDRFRYVEGVDDKPVHSFGGDGGTGASFFKSAPRGEMVGAYAYAELVTGATSRVVILTRDDVLAARDSGGYKATDAYSPWNRMDGGEGHPEFRGRSMWWKTGAKRLEPWVPTSAEYRRESLRASASAAEHAIGRRDLPELPAAARAVDVSTGEIVDAVLVDDPAGTPDASPAQPASPPPASAAPSAGAGEAQAARPPVRASERLVGMINGRMEDLGYGGDEKRPERLRVIARLAGRKEPLGSSKDLTAVEAAAARRRLERVTTPEGLDGVLAELALADDPRDEAPDGE